MQNYSITMEITKKEVGCYVSRLLFLPHETGQRMRADTAVGGGYTPPMHYGIARPVKVYHSNSSFLRYKLRDFDILFSIISISFGYYTFL